MDDEDREQEASEPEERRGIRKARREMGVVAGVSVHALMRFDV